MGISSVLLWVNFDPHYLSTFNPFTGIAAYMRRGILQTKC